MYAVQTSVPEAAEAGRHPVRLEPMNRHLTIPLLHAAMQDNHRVIVPTHAVTRGDEVVGYASLGALKLFFAWLHTSKLSAHESFRAWRAAEAAAAGQGLCMAVSPDSPLLPYVERMGYERLGPAVLFIKKG